MLKQSYCCDLYRRLSWYLQYMHMIGGKNELKAHSYDFMDTNFTCSSVRSEVTFPWPQYLHFCAAGKMKLPLLMGRKYPQTSFDCNHIKYKNIVCVLCDPTFTSLSHKYYSVWLLELFFHFSSALGIRSNWCIDVTVQPGLPETQVSLKRQNKSI